MTRTDDRTRIHEAGWYDRTQVADAKERERQRQEVMLQNLFKRRLERWPGPCSLCGAAAGQRCISRTGKRAREHVERGA